MQISSFFSRLFESSRRKKPLGVALKTEGDNSLQRTLTIFDLLCIGIGGTVGTGIFALCGYIASQDAGPSVVLCWLISGFACALSGFSYMEMSTRIPCAGSTYAYAYVALGELPAVIAGWCLTLEYGVSGATVARSWASKVTSWLITMNPSLKWYEDYLTYPYANALAGALQLLCVVVLLCGVTLGKITINVMTLIKLALIAFMTITAYCYYDPANVAGGFPPPPSPHHDYGWNGVLLGSTAAFFGFIGFDEVCCMAAEAKEPGKVMHIAVLGTIIGTTVISVIASLSLVGMQNYLDLDPNSAFGIAFHSLGLTNVAQITQIGELLTLPVVVLIAFMAQPRLQYAMAEDGLLPKIFSRLSDDGNLTYGTLIGGVFCTLLALCVPFQALGDLCSAGVLLSFSMTNASLIMLRRHDPCSGSKRTPILLSVFSVASCVGAYLLTQFLQPEGLSFAGQLVMWNSLEVAIGATVGIYLYCPSIAPPVKTFKAPLVPFLPLLAIAVNFFMLAQLSWGSLATFGVYMGFALLSYVFYGAWNSTKNDNTWHLMLTTDGMECSCKGCRNPAPSVISRATSRSKSNSSIGWTPEMVDDDLKAPLVGKTSDDGNNLQSVL